MGPVMRPEESAQTQSLDLGLNFKLRGRCSFLTRWADFGGHFQKTLCNVLTKSQVTFPHTKRWSQRVAQWSVDEDKSGRRRRGRESSDGQCCPFLQLLRMCHVQVLHPGERGRHWKTSGAAHGTAPAAKLPLGHLQEHGADDTRACKTGNAQRYPREKGISCKSLKEKRQRAT